MKKALASGLGCDWGQAPSRFLPGPKTVPVWSGPSLLAFSQGAPNSGSGSQELLPNPTPSTLEPRGGGGGARETLSLLSPFCLGSE